MATAANNSSLILNISGTQSVALKRGEKTNLIAKAGQRYRVVKEGAEAAAKDVAASQQGQDLLLTYADGTQVLLVSFYEACKAEQCAVDMPGAKGTGTSGGYVITGDSAVGASLSDGGKLVYAFGDTPSMAGLTQGAEQAQGFTHQDSVSTYMPPSAGAAFWTPLKLAVGAVGAAALLHHDDQAAPVPTIIHGCVVAGPVVAGNGLTAVAYKADGTVLASAAVNADGTFTLNVGNDYLGGVLVKVSDTNANPDYFDEATGAPKDLSTDLRALTVIPAAGTYNVSVNVLTELAVRNLGLSGGDTGNSSTSFTSVTQTQIVQANQQVATAVGLTQDLVLGAAPVAIITTTGVSNAQSNDYGRLLAALSGAEVGSDTNAVLVDLTAKLQSTQTQATGQVLETLLEGAAKVNLVAAISDITNQKSTAITIDAVAQDNRLSPAEMIAGVQVQGTAAAGASVALAWSDSTGTATATGTRTVTADSQGHWSTSFTSAEMPALGATTLKATVGSDAATRSIYLDEPLAPTITLTQMTGSNGNLTRNGHVDVSGILSGAGWDYSLDGGSTWTAGSGNGFTATGDGAKQVLVRQNIGGHTSPNSNRLDFALDATAPSALSFALASDSGTSSSDGISNAGAVTVTGIEAGATWQYSTDSGTTWNTGSGTSFTLAEASYAAGSVQVSQRDAAGNASPAMSNAAAITIDTTGPTALSFALATDSGSSTSDGTSNSGAVNVTGLESGATWEYSTNGGTTWSTGTGTSFTLTEASYATGSVKVRQTDTAGNTSTVASSSATITMDATAPTVTISSSATSLGANATATLTFTLSEAIAAFGANNVTVTGGALSNFSGSGTSYTATFTPDAGLSGAATVNVDASVLTDAAGNANSAASNTVSITVDTQAPTVASITASRSSLLVDQTASLSITLSEASTTFALADLQAVGGTLSNLQGAGSSYTATFTPDDNRTAPGSVSVTARSFSDAAGNDSEKSDNDGVVLGIQTLRPTATLQARQAKLGMGDATTIDITLSEKSSDFVLADLTASHGTLSEFTPKGDGIHYSVLFTPEAPYTGSGGVTLADGRFTNAAGNSNKGENQAASTDSLAIDTTPPTVTITSDVTALSIGQSAKVTFTFNKDPGDSFDAKDITVNGGTLANLVNNTGNIWSATFTPTDGSTGEASITVASGRYTDAAGNKGTAGTTPTITIDTQGPVADSLLPGNATTVLPGHALVLNFNEVVHKGTGNLVLVNDTASTRTTLAVTDSAVVLSNDGKTLTITPATTLVAGSQYHVEADPASLLDAAGNAWAGIASSDWANSGWHFTAATPSVSLNKITADNRINGAENTAGVTISGLIESNTAGMVAAFVAGDFAVTLTPQGGGANITANASSYNTTTGAWSLTLASNALVDGKTYNVGVAVTGTSGSALNATANTSGRLLVDLSAAVPTLTLLNDTGSSNSDGKTSDATVSVAGLEAKASWEYTTDSGSTWHAGSGTQFTGAITDGASSVQVRQTDAAGNVSSNGTLTFTLDTTAAKPVINAVATNNIINASEVGSAITGTAEAGASVQLVLGMGEQERTVTVTANGSGNWTHTLNAADMAALGTGEMQSQITAKQTDVAGNTSFTTLRNITVDTFVPTVSIETYQTQLSAANPTTQIRFTLSEKSADFTASSVTVTGGTLGTLQADATGLVYTGTFTPTNAATTAGSVKVAAGAFHDAAGNANATASNTVDLTVDTVVPTVAIASSLTTLQATDVATVTFTLSEASDDFGADSITVVGGTLGKLMSNAAGTVYTGIFTPTEGFAGAGSVSVASSAFHDRGNNANTDGSEANNTVALTIQASAITLDVTSDKTELKVGETATISFAFSAAPTGFAAGDITVAGGTLGALTTVDSTHYTATFTPTTSAASGTASISVAAGTYTGASGNLGEGGKAVEISFDTLAPTLKTLNPDDNGYLAAAAGVTLVATFTESVLAGTGSIRLVDDTAGTTATYAITDSAIVIDGDKLTLTPSTALVAGHNYHLSIDNTALVDTAGNAYVGIANATTWNFGATNLSTTLNLVTGDGRINSAEKTASDNGDLIVITGTISSVNPAVLTALAASDITVTLTVPRDGGWNDNTNKIIHAVETYDPATGNWTATVPKNWVYDGFTSNSTVNTFVNGETDTVKVTVTGRSGTAAAGLSVTVTDTLVVDTTTPATPTLTLAGDTGASTSDGITRNGLINVGALEAGSTWEYSLDTAGSWQAGAGSSLAISKDGSYTVQVRQSDAAGNTSTTRSLAVTLDTQATAPVVNATATDNRINASETTSAISGTADAGASVSLVIGANTRTVTADSSGVWSYTLGAGDITAMGQGNEVISVTQTDKAGNTSGKTNAVIEVDTVRPTVTLANTGSSSLLAGQSTTITATLSELPADFTESSFTVSGGVLSDLKADSTGLIYTGTFTPTADSTTAGSIQLAAGAVHDAANNTNASASNALAITVNTVVPTVAVTSNVAAGTTLHAGDTATLTFTLSAASSDFTDADVTVTGGTLSNFAGTGTSYTATYTPDANSTAPGRVSVGSGTFANAAGNSNADGLDANNSVAFAIATARPTVTISSDLGTLGGGQTAVITFNFSETPGSSFIQSDINVTGGTLSDFRGKGTTYSAMFTPTAGFAGSVSITVADGAYTNSAGSSGQAGVTPAITIDAAAPTVAISRSASGTLGAGQTDTITFDFSEAPGSSFDATDVVVSGGTLGTISAVSATQYVATFTPTANAAGTAKISIASNTFADAAGNFNADGADANNTLAIAYATANISAVTVSATDVPTLSLAADTGSNTTDHITNNGVINVGNLVAGATWQYTLDGSVTSPVWLTGTGTSFTLPSAGTYSALQVRQTDGTTTSNVGSLLGAAVDYRAGYVGSPTLALTRDSGTSATDGISYDGRVTVSGLSAGDTWTYSTDNGLSWTTGTTTTLNNQQVNLVPQWGPAGAETPETLLVRATDIAGNTKEVKYSFTLDLKNPAAPNVSLTPDPNDGGAILAATNIEAGATVAYSLDAWITSSSTYTPPTAPGSYTLQVLQKDVAGNGAQTVLNFTVPAAAATPIELSAVAQGTGGFVINGQFGWDSSGYSVSSAGDVNGDGLADLIVGGPYSSPASGAYAGRSYVVFGKTSGTGIDLSAVAGGTGGFVIIGQSRQDYSGYSVSSAGDVNGDGLADLIVGAYNSFSSSGTYAGRSYVVFGKTSGTGIDLSAVAGGTGGFVINGQCAGDSSGYSVSSAGDVNGDGLADLIVGACYSDPASVLDAGRSYVVFGKTSGTGIDLSAVAGGTGGFVINGQSRQDYSGYSVSSAGDVNGDGLADLIVGANQSDPASGKDAGCSYVVFGKTSGTGIDLSAVAGGTGGFVINGQCASDQSGYSVSSAGDVNGDGLADLIVGAYFSSPASADFAGRSYVVFGKSTNTAIDLAAVAAGIGGFVMNGAVGGVLVDSWGGPMMGPGDQSGISVSGAGDVNGDGLADLIVGANLSDPSAGTNAGRSYVVFGKTSGTGIDLSAVEGGTGGFVINGQCNDDNSGISVSSAGDVNGDGLADLIVGANNSDPALRDNAGRSYVIFGNTTGAFSQTAVDWLGTDAADTQSDGGVAKTLVAGAGDDSLTATAASVLYGGAGNDSFTIGQAMITALHNPMGKGGNVAQLARIDGGSGIDKFVLSGSGLTLDLTQVANQAGGNPDGGSRIDSIEAIDLTGTGNNTLVLTARDVMDMAGMNVYNSGNGWTGLAASVPRHQVVVDGNAGDKLKLGIEWVAAKGTVSLGNVGYKVYNAGTGAQLLVNTAMTVDIPPQVVDLSAVAAGVGGFVINGQCSDQSGNSVSSAGDVNGDGLADLIVGASAANSYSGRSYVVFGKTSGTGIDLSAVAGGTGGFVINGQGNFEFSGTSVSSAGDVNGDGLADLIIGAYWSYPASGPYAGRSYVVFGKTSGTGINLSAVAGGTGGFVINGQSTGDYSGNSVSSAGDVNGDGLADLIIGASAANGSSGRSYVVFGKTSGTDINLSAVAGGTGGFVINGQSEGDQSGCSVSSAGDVNGDGLADLIVGANKSDPAFGKEAGRSYVVFGKTSGTGIDLAAVAGGIGGFVINGRIDSDESGVSVSSAGDVNGDGLADLIVGANLSDTTSVANAGRSYVVFGKNSGTPIDLFTAEWGVTGFVINGQCQDDQSGISVSSAGDVNGDGLADLIVGAAGTNRTDGRSFVVFGKTSYTVIELSAVAGGTGGFLIKPADGIGKSVSSAGDVNGDGLADLIVGDSAANQSRGSSYVIFGSTTGAFNQTAVDWLGTDAADTQSDGGVAKTLVAGAGDDSLTATAASVLHGGAGNDGFTINQAMITALQNPMGLGGNVDRLARIDGGGGVDKIVLSGSGLTFDLTQVANQAASNPDGGSRIDSVEKFDITGSGNNILKLTAKDVLELGSGNLFKMSTTDPRQQILVMGNAGDKVDLADGTGSSGTGGWTKASATIDGIGYVAWSHTADKATVYVQTGVVVI